MKRVWLVLAALVVILLLAGGCMPNARYWGRDVNVRSGEVHEGDLVVLGGDARIHQGGRVTGSLVVMGGETRIEGQVDGDVVVYGGDVRLSNTAVVRGDLVSYGGEIRRDEGAQVLGQSVSGGRGGWPMPVITSPPVTTGPWVGMPVVSISGSELGFWGFLRNVLETIIYFLAIAALGILLIAFAPAHLSRVQQTAVEMWPISLGVGFLTLLVAALATIVLLAPAIILFIVGLVLTVTIVGAILGIPVILVGVILLCIPGAAAVAGALMGGIAISQYVGDRVLAVVSRPTNPYLSFVVGLVLLMLLSAVPCIGWVLALGIVCIALGAVVLSRVGTMLPPQIASEPILEPPPISPEPAGVLPAETGPSADKPRRRSRKTEEPA